MSLISRSTAAGLPPAPTNFSAYQKRSTAAYMRRYRSAVFNANWHSIVSHYGGACLNCRNPRVQPGLIDYGLRPGEALNCLARTQPLCRKCVKLDLGDLRSDKGQWILDTYGPAAQEAF